MNWLHRLREKISVRRQCPHCFVEMSEGEMMKHITGCYSANFTATRNGFYAEYRGSVTKINHAIKQFREYNRFQPTDGSQQGHRDPVLQIGQAMEPLEKQNHSEPAVQIDQAVGPIEEENHSQPTDGNKQEHPGPVLKVNHAMRKFRGQNYPQSTRRNKQRHRCVVTKANHVTRKFRKQHHFQPTGRNKQDYRGLAVQMDHVMEQCKKQNPSERKNQNGPIENDISSQWNAKLNLSSDHI